MSSVRPLVPAFSPPTPEEAAALSLAAAYFSRAATEMGSRLMPEVPLLALQIDLLATLRDNFTGSAALCECLLAVFDEWPVSEQSRLRLVPLEQSYAAAPRARP
jgi:hypothetical protein